MTLRLSVLSAFAATALAVSQVFGQDGRIDYSRLSPQNPDRDHYIQSLRDSVAQNPKYLFDEEFPNWFVLRQKDGAEAKVKFSEGVYDRDGVLQHKPGMILYTKRQLFRSNSDSTIYYTAEEEQIFIDNNRNGKFDYTVDLGDRFDKDYNESVSERIVIRKHWQNGNGTDVVLSEHVLGFDRYSKGGLMTVNKMSVIGGIPVAKKPMEYEKADTLFIRSRGKLLRSFLENPDAAAAADTTYYQAFIARSGAAPAP